MLLLVVGDPLVEPRRVLLVALSPTFCRVAQYPGPIVSIVMLEINVSGATSINNSRRARTFSTSRLYVLILERPRPFGHSIASHCIRPKSSCSSKPTFMNDLCDAPYGFLGVGFCFLFDTFCFTPDLRGNLSALASTAALFSRYSCSQPFAV